MLGFPFSLVTIGWILGAASFFCEMTLAFASRSGGKTPKTKMMKKQKQSLRWQEIWDAEERDKDERRIKNGQQRGTGEEANGGLDEMKAKERTT